MKEVIQINLKGMVFHMDDDAHALLKTYMQEVEEYFRHVQYGHEIIDDFELRLVELLKEKLTKSKEVITLQDVEQILNTLGNVGDFDNNPSHSARKDRERTRRKLFRDPEQATMGGVAAGIATYLNVDVVWIRLAFVLSIFLNGLGIIAYLIMWIIVPAARTVTQRMEMKGEPVRFENIEANIREEYEKVKQNFSNLSSSSSYQASKHALADFFRITGHVIWLLLKALAAIIGLVLIITGSLLIVAMLFAWLPFHFQFPWDGWSHMPNLSDLLTRFIPTGMIMPLILSIWISILIPLLSLIYGGIKLIFRIRVKDAAAGAFLFAAWILAVVFIASVIVMQYPNFQEEKSETSQIQLTKWQGDTLYVSTIRPQAQTNIPGTYFLGENYALIITPERTDIAGKAEVNIYPAKITSPEMKLIQSALGESYYDAEANVKNIDYNWNIEGSHLYIAPFFYLEPDTYFRLQTLDIDLYIPVGTIVYFDPSMFRLIDYAKMDSGNRYDLAGKHWRMTKNGLLPAETIQ